MGESEEAQEQRAKLVEQIANTIFELEPRERGTVLRMVKNLVSDKLNTAAKGAENTYMAKKEEIDHFFNGIEEKVEGIKPELK